MFTFVIIMIQFIMIINKFLTIQKVRQPESTTRIVQ